MKIIIPKENFKDNIEYFLRRKCSYIPISNRYTGKDSFVRKLTANYYPRFHMYIKESRDKIIFDLHLDQKKPSYAGSHAHNAEYEGEAVEAEIERLKALIGINKKNENKSFKEVDSKRAEDKIGEGNYKKEAETKKRKGFFSLISELFK